jgi:hypothetical protein
MREPSWNWRNDGLLVILGAAVAGLVAGALAVVWF